MAVLTVGTAFTPYQGYLMAAGVKRVEFDGTGTDASQLVALTALSVVVIVGGRISANGATIVEITSDANVLDEIQFAAAGTAILPVSLETNAGEALKLKKSEAVIDVRGYCDYVVIAQGGKIELPGFDGLKK